MTTAGVRELQNCSGNASIMFSQGAADARMQRSAPPFLRVEVGCMNRSPSMPEKETTATHRPAAAQINLFTGEVEPPVVTVEPEDQASEEISVDEGISLIK